MNLNIRQVRAFLLTARYRSFSRAAEQLYISQSGISVMMREMEAQLGFRLFNRTTRKVTLTEFGKKLLPVADASLQALQASIAELAHAASNELRRFTVGVTPLIATHLAPPAVAEYSRENPNVQIRLYDAERPRIIAMVESGELDMGIGVFMKPTSNVRAVPLARFELMAIGPRRSRGRSLTWEALAELPLIALPPDSNIQQLVTRYLARGGRKRPPDLIVNSLEAQIAMAEAGGGYAVLPTFAVPACKRWRVAMHALADPTAELDLYRIHNRGKALPAEIQRFSAFLQSYMAPWTARRARRGQAVALVRQPSA